MSDGIVLQTQFGSSSTNIPINSSMPSILSFEKSKNKYLSQYGPFGLVILLLIVILIIVAVIVSRVSTQSAVPIEISSTTIQPTTAAASLSNLLVNSISIEDMFVHLRQFESRAVGEESFNRTIDYLAAQLSKENSFTIEKYYFSFSRTVIDPNSVLLSLPNVSNESIFTYPQDFVAMDKSTEAVNWSLIDGRPLSFVRNLGCHLEDWNHTHAGDVVLVRRGNCTFTHKIWIAMQKNASAFLIYNDGLTIDRLAPLNHTRAPKNNTIPTLFLSYEAGNYLILQNITRIYIKLQFRTLPPAIITNICADTKFGDPNQTIVVGSHSDSVSAGPGMNDNGSGMAGTLAIALHISRLLKQTNYAENIHSRIKFCWWGGEEMGLLGSTEYVRRAKVDGSLRKYLVNLNFDMIASPNFIFGVYDGKTANNNTTPVRALPGSNRITRLFTDYFDQQRLPWDYTDFSGRSDYGPFLSEGIACGGLFTGADGEKSQEQRDRYLRMLGSTLSGMARTDFDPCYHRKCDTLENLNQFAYLHMVKAAAYSIDYLAKLRDLNQWLYP